jgi:hypothetical protein
VVTLTGTDANHDLSDRSRGPVVRQVLEAAAAVVAFHHSVAAAVVARLPGLAERVVVVPQSVRFDDAQSFDLAAHWTVPADRVLFAFPAGIRAVKRACWPLGPLDRVVARHGAVRLLYVGEILDPAEGRALRDALTARPWARHLGAVPHAQMASLLSQADVVLNCSASEGGMANSVLEALSLGRAVLASDIAGNRSLVEPGVTGLLAADASDFERGAEALTVDAELRGRLGRAGRERVERLYPPCREIDEYLDLYRRLTGLDRGGPGGAV